MRIFICVYLKLIINNLGLGGNRIRETHQLWDEITKKNLYKEEFLSYWRELELDLCIGPCFACPAPRSVDVAKLSRELYIYRWSIFSLPFIVLHFLIIDSCSVVYEPVQFSWFPCWNPTDWQGKRRRSNQARNRIQIFRCGLQACEDG